MGQNWSKRGINFWRAGAAPVRPVSAFRGRCEDERGAKEVKKTATKEKRAGITTEQADKAEKALEREDKRQYHEAVDEERKAEEDGERRESKDTGGSSGSDDRTEKEEEEEEGRSPEALAVPEGPSNREREEHNLTHIPFRDWCEHCVKGRARKRAHKKRNQEVKKEELKRATRVYMDFYYNGIGEKEEEREEDEWGQE